MFSGKTHVCASFQAAALESAADSFVMFGKWTAVFPAARSG